MKKTLLFILGIITATIYAYNPEATQKLQEKYRNTIKKDNLWDLTLTAQPAFLKDLEKLIIEGADPNAPLDKDVTVLEIIICAPIWNKNINAREVERVLKVALDNGMKVNFPTDPTDRDKRFFIFKATEEGNLNIIRMLISASNNEQQIQQNKNSAIAAIKEMIKEDIEIATRVNNMQKILNELESNQITNAKPKL